MPNFKVLLIFIIILSALISLISCVKKDTTSIVDSDIELLTPTNFQIRSTSYTSCKLTWDYAILGSEEGFKIERRIGDDNWIEIAQLSINDTSYEDIALTEGETYEYMLYTYKFETDQVNAITQFFTMDFVVIDIDGNVYDIVQIGDQYWISENLKVTHYNNGASIFHIADNEDWANADGGAYCFYDNEPANAEKYGNLYNWAAVNDTRGIAPAGWHIPSDEEIMYFEMYLGMSEADAQITSLRGTNEGSKLAGNADLWVDDDLVGSSEFGSSDFNLLPAGYRSRMDGEFNKLGQSSNFWSSSASASNTSWARSIYYRQTRISRGRAYVRGGLSVRCLRD